MNDIKHPRKFADKTISWKEWKKQRKEEYKKFKEEEKIKKLKKQQKRAELENSQNDIQNTLPNKYYTLSIALPGSILDNAQSEPLKAYLAGQIARAAAIFNVVEIIVFDETGLANSLKDDDEQSLKLCKKFQGCAQMARILQYLECPQYLRRYFFPLHKDLEFAGVLNPLDIPHHLRMDEESPYREGVVLNKPVRPGKGSFVYIGLKQCAIIDKVLEPNVRVTVKLDKEKKRKKHYTGKAVSPLVPHKYDQIYWGYNVRFAKNLKLVFSESPFKNGYDLTIGTSDKGQNVDTCELPTFKHLLLVFGGLNGLEACLEYDETLDVNEPKELFNYYINTCPSQGSRTIRTEEAILITLAALRPKILQIQGNTVNNA